MSWDRDGLIAAVALVSGLAASVLLVWDPQDAHGSEIDARVVGTLSFSSADVQRRPANRLGWGALGRGDAVHELDAIFVPPGVEAKVTFKDGTQLELDERSLVVIDASRSGRRNVSIRQGSVEGSAGTAGLALTTPRGVAQLSPQSQAIVDVKADSVAMAVTKGDGRLGDTALADGERGNLDATGTQALGRWPVSLTVPVRSQRRFFVAEPPPIVFEWLGAAPDARLQVARDRGFAFVLEERAAGDGSYTFRGGAGVFWWRVVDDAGQPLSESRRFTVLEDVPPVLVAPRDGEVLMSNDKQQAVFSWVGVRGVSRYKLELSSAASFNSVEWEREVEGAKLRTPLTLPEGRWYWRVKTIDEERGESGPATARAFRLVHSELPEAPELLNPEIEVEPARGK